MYILKEEAGVDRLHMIQLLILVINEVIQILDLQIITKPVLLILEASFHQIRTQIPNSPHGLKYLLNIVMVPVTRVINRIQWCHLKAKIFISEDLKILKEFSRLSSKITDWEMLKNYWSSVVQQEDLLHIHGLTGLKISCLQLLQFLWLLIQDFSWIMQTIKPENIDTELKSKISWPYQMLK